ncbi:VOC family protein [Arvimicrobium flavum]|uniref:VOC family protein n=1 Tax=Arvimicrobium flavum TaxID=3393320 RepID=UPI00237BBE66|nr:VOC family protein [Mesorhizobium shangrilense]
MTTVRYFAHDVATAIEFYTRHLDFKVKQQFGAVIAILEREGMTLWLAGPQASASRPMPNGRRPEPGGWNRFVIEVDDLPSVVEALRANGVPFRNDIVEGPGGRQILCEDPSGNVVELFEAA